MEHLGALGCQLQHLVVGDLLQLAGIGHDAGVGGVHAVHIRVDLAELCPEGRRQRHGAGIGAAPAQGGHIAHPVHALEAGDDDDAVLVQLRLDAFGIDPLDAGVGMDAGGLDAHLPRRQGHAGQAHGLQRHGAQRHGNLLSGGQQHIHLPLGGVGIDLLGLGDELIRGVSLGGEDHDQVISLQILLRDDTGDIPDALRVPHGAAAEFLYDQTHSVSFFASDWFLLSYAGQRRSVPPYGRTRIQASTRRFPACCRASRPLMRSVKNAVSPSSDKTSTCPKLMAASVKLPSMRK